MLLTSPLVVTVGISLTIPVSLIGQIIINHQTSSLPYWIGAVVVLLSFIFINHQSQEEENSKQPQPQPQPLSRQVVVADGAQRDGG